jgi:hypothetical protein
MTVGNSSYFIAGPAGQESGADWRAVAGVVGAGIVMESITPTENLRAQTRVSLVVPNQP